MNRLDKRVVVITGGTSGIGLACARLFEEEGAQVVLFARGEDGLKQAAQQGRKAHCAQGDVTRPEDLERLFRETKGRFGRCKLTEGFARHDIPGAVSRARVCDQPPFAHCRNSPGRRALPQRNFGRPHRPCRDSSSMGGQGHGNS
jgi:NAD(P)-dependent dehydrogenase (short-subunit alcohol dehydrogenase family)